MNGNFVRVGAMVLASSALAFGAAPSYAADYSNPSATQAEGSMMPPPPDSQPQGNDNTGMMPPPPPSQGADNMSMPMPSQNTDGSADGMDNSQQGPGQGNDMMPPPPPPPPHGNGTMAPPANSNMSGQQKMAPQSKRTPIVKSKAKVSQR